MKKIEKTKCNRYYVEGDKCSRHRLAYRAIAAARKTWGTAYAIIDGQPHVIEEHREALTGRISVSSDRYIDESGIEYVRCLDGHYEPAETRDKEGRLTSYYVSVVLRY